MMSEISTCSGLFNQNIYILTGSVSLRWIVSKQLTRCLMSAYCHDLRDAEATFELATNRFMSQIVKRQIV